jgi:hypothetical protein
MVKFTIFLLVSSCEKKLWTTALDYFLDSELRRQKQYTFRVGIPGGHNVFPKTLCSENDSIILRNALKMAFLPSFQYICIVYKISSNCGQMQWLTSVIPAT